MLVVASCLCGWRESNSQGFPHTPLKRACLPIPPHPRGLASISYSVDIIPYFFAKSANFFEPPLDLEPYNYCRDRNDALFVGWVEETKPNMILG